MRAMRAVRFGSYSIDATLPGTPVLSRRKSMMRRRRLAPPPRWRTVMRPWLLRPAWRRKGATSDFSGLERVISSKLCPLAPRRPGEVGLYCLIGTLYALEQLDLIAGGERHNGLLPVRLVLDAVAQRPARLALHHHYVDVYHFYIEPFFDCVLDLHLVRLAAHLEHVFVFAAEARGFLRNHRPDHDIETMQFSTHEPASRSFVNELRNYNPQERRTGAECGRAPPGAGLSHFNNAAHRAGYVLCAGRASMRHPARRDAG